MIHYTALDGTGGNKVCYAFLGDAHVSADIEKALGRGADMATRLFRSAWGGHQAHQAHPGCCRNQMDWTETVTTRWARNGWRWRPFERDEELAAMGTNVVEVRQK